jgi:hypothetical protein
MRNATKKAPLANPKTVEFPIFLCYNKSKSAEYLNEKSCKKTFTLNNAHPIYKKGDPNDKITSAQRCKLRLSRKHDDSLSRGGE